MAINISGGLAMTKNVGIYRLIKEPWKKTGSQQANTDYRKMYIKCSVKPLRGEAVPCYWIFSICIVISSWKLSDSR